MPKFITAALPYANGPIHIGHLVEYIQADIYVRFLKSLGNDVVFICADDAHGAPIEINAAKQGITPEQLVAKTYKEHKEDFDAFHVHFDNYYTTNSPENKAYSDKIFLELKNKGYIYQKEIELTYCPADARFLPDRYVKGECPNCAAQDQYGDVCEKCNTAYKTVDLKNPYCALCKTTPIRKKSRHYFFKVSAFSEKLEHWLTHHPHIQEEVKNFALSWIKKGLEDWDISRDGPYFGFKIPGEENMYYYVWLDAPIGYLASLANYAARNNLNPEDFFTGEGKMQHFIGKDIMYFHLLFWPAMLMGAGLNLPTQYHVHGFLTVGGEKMSKSRGTFLTAKEFLSISTPEFLRFYLASNLGSTVSDIDLNWNDYFDKINSELVSKVANYCYRVTSFCQEKFEGQLVLHIDEKTNALIEEQIKKAKESFEAINLREAVQHILEVASLGNRYFQEQQPWKTIATNKEEAHKATSYAVHIARQIAILLSPIAPLYCAELSKQLNMNSTKWSELSSTHEHKTISAPKIIITKIEDVPSTAKKVEPFSELYIKVGVIKSVEDHPKADKLYVLELDTGEKRQIVAGLRAHITKDELLGKHVLIICNLKPAMLRGIESQGMMLAADDGEKVVPLLAPNSAPGLVVSAGEINAITPPKEITFDEFKKVILTVKNNHAMYQHHALRTSTEDVQANIKDNAQIR